MRRSLNSSKSPDGDVAGMPDCVSFRYLEMLMSPEVLHVKLYVKV